MFKGFLFQMHWLLGISAGLVLALIGLTGALYSFSDELIHLIDPAITRVKAGGRSMLAAPDLLAQIQRTHPFVSSLTLSADPREAARVGFMRPLPGTDQKKFELQYLNPYTGELLGKPTSEEGFRTILKLHRHLLLDEPGAAIAGASTMAFLFLLVSGLYLRWPKTRPLDSRNWLRLDMKSSGRNFFSNLHAVMGSWLWLAYLVFALTGLCWSYTWVRSGLEELLGAPKAESVAARTKPKAQTRLLAITLPEEIDLYRIWKTFQDTAPAYQKMILLLPSSPQKPVQILYLSPDAPHPYANNRMLIDSLSGALQKHELYAAKSAGEKLLASLYALHSGAYFGTPGRIIMWLASLLLPLFGLTSWIMYLQRRKNKKSAN